jgi:hypothetical protein
MQQAAAGAYCGECPRATGASLLDQHGAAQNLRVSQLESVWSQIDPEKPSKELKVALSRSSGTSTQVMYLFAAGAYTCAAAQLNDIATLTRKHSKARDSTA